ncbi:hypothetical protein PG990_004356 [Apiospora arundinis]
MYITTTFAYMEPQTRFPAGYLFVIGCGATRQQINFWSALATVIPKQLRIHFPFASYFWPFLYHERYSRPSL